MENEMMKQAGLPEDEAPTIVFDIGGSKYTVGIHFSNESKETMPDKIHRMIRRDILEGAFIAS